jgi:hypothetical protein
MTNHRIAARLVKDYALWLRDDCGAENALTLAALEAESDFELAHIGAAILDRNETLADAAYRFGGANFDSRLAAIAEATGWAA